MPTNEQINKAWENSKTIPGKDPAKYRKDPYGNEICRDSYGMDSKKGWEVDHIKPLSRGGSDATRNLQALNTHMNKRKGDSLVKRSRHSKRNK